MLSSAATAMFTSLIPIARTPKAREGRRPRRTTAATVWPHGAPPSRASRAGRLPRCGATLGRLLLLLPLAVAPACQYATVDRSLTAQAIENEPADQLDFWHTLVERDVTSNDEAFYALLLFLDGEVTADSYEARVAELKRRGLLLQDFDRPANEAITRGHLAVVLVQALDIRGGVIMRTFGPSPRYATKELAHLGIYPVSGAHQPLTGEQFVATVGLAEDYLRQKGRRTADSADAPKPKPSTGAPDEPEAEPSSPETAIETTSPDVQPHAHRNRADGAQTRAGAATAETTAPTSDAPEGDDADPRDRRDVIDVTDRIVPLE